MIDQAAHYTALREKYGHGARAAGWGSEDTQAARLRVLADLVVEAGSVLDVGSGDGRLWDFLCPRGLILHYEGWDICPSAVEAAASRLPSGLRDVFFLRNILAWSGARRFDYVLASGLFTHGDQGFFLAALARMWDLCARVCAFNFLTAWGETPVEGEFRADPVGVVTACRQLPGMTGKLVLRTDYLGAYDATVVLFR